MSNSPKVSKGTREEANYVRSRLIEFNSCHVLNGRYEEINLCVKNDKGIIIAGLNSVIGRG